MATDLDLSGMKIDVMDTSRRGDNQTSPKGYRATSGAVTVKPLDAWEQANQSPWYHPQFWLDLFIQPSKQITINHQRRRARLYALVSFVFLIVSIIANCLYAADGRSRGFVSTHIVVNIMLFISYILSRTVAVNVGKSLGVFAVWLLPYVNTILMLTQNYSADVTVTDSVNWLFTPAWLIMSAIFLSRSMTISVVLWDCFSLLFLPSFANSTFFAIKRLLFYHMVCGILLLLASLVAFRDKLQLISQADGGRDSDHQHQAGNMSRFFLQPHSDVTDRIFRRRSRVLSAILLGMIPSAFAWMIVEAVRWHQGQSSGGVFGITVAVLVCTIILYGLSRSQHTRWASRLTLFMLLVIPYVYYLAPTTTMDDRMFVDILCMTSTAILGVTLFSGPELVGLAAIVFFPTVYSPLFPPHVILSLILLVSAVIYRSDIQEIHETVVMYDEVNVDPESQGPWSKTYLFGKLNYTEMVNLEYVSGFFMLFVLGLAALIGAANGGSAAPGYVSADIVDTSGQASYSVYVHAMSCSSTAGQVYTITGTRGMFEVIDNTAITPNTLNAIHVHTAKSIGIVTAITFTMGTSGFSVTSQQKCEVDRIDVWDYSTSRGYSTSYVPSSSASANPSATTSGRRLLQTPPTEGVFRDGCDVTQPTAVNGVFGQRVLTFEETQDCNFVGLNVQETTRCEELIVNSGFSPLSWAKQTCDFGFTNTGDANFLGSVMPCFSLGCDGSESAVCSGVGHCVIMRSPSGFGNYTSRSYQVNLTDFYGNVYAVETVVADATTQNFVAVCECDPGYMGPLCDIPSNLFCAAAGYAQEARDPSGICTDWNNPLAGCETGDANTPILNRLGDNTYADGIEQECNTSDVLPWVNRNADIGQLNLLGVGFLEVALQDIASIYFGGDGRAAETSGTGVVTGFAISDGSCFAAAREYINGGTYWLDLGNLYALYDGSSAILDDSVVISYFAAATLPYVTVMRLLVHTHNFFATQLPISGCDIDEGTLYLAAQQANVYFYQNVLRWHLLPAFFEFQSGSTPGSTPDYAHVSSAYIAPDNANTPEGEAPLALLLNLTQTLYGATIPTIDATSTIDPFVLELRALMATPALAFGTSGVSASEYAVAHELAEDLGLPEFHQFRCNLLGDTYEGCASTNGSSGNDTSSSSGSVDYSFGAGACEDDLYNGLINEAQQVGPFMGYELDLQSTFYSAQSSWPPTALALTYGTIRRALISDPRYKGPSADYTVWDPSLESAMAMVCGGTLTNSLVLDLVSQPDALANVLTGAGLINALNDSCGSLTWPLIVSQNGVNTDASNDFSSCCYVSGAACRNSDPTYCSEPDQYGNCPIGCYVAIGVPGCISNPCYPFVPGYCPAGCKDWYGNCIPNVYGY